VTVRSAVNAALKNSEATKLESELAKALAKQIDRGEGTAAASKELRSLMASIEQRQPETDGLDELERRRAARRAG
jgi:hypothetical protein